MNVGSSFNSRGWKSAVDHPPTVSDVTPTMDPITQTVCGAIAAQAIFNKKLGRSAVLFGAIGGILPDVDVFFQYSDPIVAWDMHRHFTHALAFIPIGGLIAALPFLLRSHWRQHWKLALGAATVGCATHGLIDCCTSYGTYLLWPFTNARYAWDNMSIIDPVFTLPILIGVLWALARGTTRPARIALTYAFIYLGMSVVQHARVMNVQQTLAEQRGHEIARGRVMPTFANQIVWRSIYESGGMLHADAVRVPLFGHATVKRGESVALMRLDDLAAPLKEDEYIRSSFETFSHFADGYLAVIGGATDDPILIGDVRYSLTAGGFAPMWGIAISRGNPEPTAWPTGFSSNRNRSMRDLWREILDDTGYESVTVDGK